MRRAALLLTLALTALLASSAFWRPLRPGPVPGPAGPLAVLSHNLGLGPGELPGHATADGPAVFTARRGEPANKFDQLAAEKPYQPPLSAVVLLDPRVRAAQAARPVRGGTKALRPYPVSKPHPDGCPNSPARPRRSDPDTPFAWLVVWADAPAGLAPFAGRDL